MDPVPGSPYPVLSTETPLIAATPANPTTIAADDNDMHEVDAHRNWAHDKHVADQTMTLHHSNRLADKERALLSHI